MNKKVKNHELFDLQSVYLKEIFEQYVYPWEIIRNLKDVIYNLRALNINSFCEVSKGIFLGENVKISDGALIEAPAIIGDCCEIRFGAYLRGNVIVGDNCVIGNSSEIKNSILLNSVQAPHYNYVGDSILGNNAHLGAGAVCSNLKSDKKDVVIHGDKDYITGMRKIGAVLGDNAEVGCNCVLNPGTVIGKNTSIYPLTSVRGVIPENSIMKSTDTIVLRN